MVEISAYGIENLLGDFGGITGIMLGVTVISMVEFVFMTVSMIVYCLTGGRVSLISEC